MDADAFRRTIRTRLVTLGITAGHAARLARLPDQTVRDYLSGATDLRAGLALQLAAGLGLVVTARAKPGFDPGPTPARGRKKNPEKSGRNVPT